MKIPKRFEIIQKEDTITIILQEEDTGYIVEANKRSDNRGEGSIVFKNTQPSLNEDDLICQAIYSIREHFDSNFTIVATFDDSDRKDFHIKDYAIFTKYNPQTGELSYRLNPFTESPFENDLKVFFDGHLNHLIMKSHLVLKYLTKIIKDEESNYIADRVADEYIDETF